LSPASILTTSSAKFILDKSLEKAVEPLAIRLSATQTVSLSATDLIAWLRKDYDADLLLVDIPAEEEVTGGEVKKVKKPVVAAAPVTPKESGPGIDHKKEDDFSGWYTSVLKKSEMLEYYDVSGCYIIRPWAFKIWKSIQGIK
jgi:prolyl-tRNA synthetase